MAVAEPMLLNAFIQVNTIRGYQYFDDAGKIVNFYDHAFPQKQVGIDGTTLANPGASVRQLNVSAQRIWIHVEEPDTLTYAADQSWKFVAQICQMLNVTSLSRVAMRLQYAAIADDIVDLVGVVQERLFTEAANARIFNPSGASGAADAGALERASRFLLAVPLAHDSLMLNLQVAPGQVTTASGKAGASPSQALIFDVDAYREGEVNLPHGRRTLRDIEHWANEEFVEIIEQFVEGGN